MKVEIESSYLVKKMIRLKKKKKNAYNQAKKKNQIHPKIIQ